MDDYLTVAQTAAVLGLTPVGVRARLERGLMQGERVHPRLWLIPRAEVERWRPLGKVGGKRRAALLQAVEARAHDKPATI